MKIDHLVVNVDPKYQRDGGTVEAIRNSGLPYQPTWGKGTAGFKVSDLWMGDEYLELVRIRKESTRDWIEAWTERYNGGHRGMICLMLDVSDIDAVYCRLRDKNIAVTPPEWLQFRWFFRLLTRTMPWRNCYAPFFEGAPFQIGFQQMKDTKARAFMEQYMVPNARDNGIDGIERLVVRAAFTDSDFALLHAVFGARAEQVCGAVRVGLDAFQTIEFRKAEEYRVDLVTKLVGRDRATDIADRTNSTLMTPSATANVSNSAPRGPRPFAAITGRMFFSTRTVSKQTRIGCGSKIYSSIAPQVGTAAL